MIIFRQALSKVSPYTPGKPIEEVKRELGLKEISKLASNEIPFEPTYIKSAVLKEISKINRYPESGCFYLRKALAKKHKVDPDRIVFGNGSDELITLTIRALVEPGDEIIIGFPTFLIYEIQGNAQSAAIVKVPLKQHKYDLASILKVITPRTRAIFIANPDNPNGTYVTNSELNSFLEGVPINIAVYLDEAYFEFGPKDFPKSQAILKRYSNVIIARTFSKAYGLAGLRVGYAITTKDIAIGLNKIREPFNINRFAQVAAIAALKNKKFLSKVINHVAKEKKYLYSELNKLKLNYIKSATNFILIDFGENTEKLNQYLLSNGIIIRQLKGWGLPNFFRVTVGLKRENKKFIDCLTKYVGTGLRACPLKLKD